MVKKNPHIFRNIKIYTQLTVLLLCVCNCVEVQLSWRSHYKHNSSVYKSVTETSLHNIHFGHF